MHILIFFIVLELPSSWEKKNVRSLSGPLLFPWRIGSHIEVLIYQTTTSNQFLLIVCCMLDSAGSAKKDRKNVDTVFEESSTKSLPIRKTIQSSQHASTWLLHILLSAQI